RTARAFQLPLRLVVVDRHDEPIGFGSGPLQISHMSYMQQIEAAVRDGDSFSRRPVAGNQGDELGFVDNHGRRPCAGASSSVASDRKSTRLNSSHRTISYAVFCLKKKKKKKIKIQKQKITLEAIIRIAQTSLCYPLRELA